MSRHLFWCGSSRAAVSFAGGLRLSNRGIGRRRPNATLHAVAR